MSGNSSQAGKSYDVINRTAEEQRPRGRLAPVSAMTNRRTRRSPTTRLMELPAMCKAQISIASATRGENLRQLGLPQRHTTRLQRPVWRLQTIRVMAASTGYSRPCLDTGALEDRRELRIKCM
jgi:hypothetical protein